MGGTMKTPALRSVLLTLAFASAFANTKELYRGNQVLRVNLETKDDLKWLLELEQQTGGNLDFWSSLSTNSPVDIMVSRDYVAEIKAKLEGRHLPYKVVKLDVQEDVNRIQSRPKRSSEGGQGVNVASYQDFNYSVYHTYDEIQQWIRDAASEYDFVKFFSLGTTYEGRDIGALEITAPPDPSATSPKPIVYFEGGLHAREWIAPATILYFTEKLLWGYSNGDADARQALRMFDFHIVPSVNCDGYVFTWTEERLWRKSRKPNQGYGCVGTDLNRNFNKFWGGAGDGASPWPCSILFRGFSAFDNFETRAIDGYFQNLKAAKRTTKVFIDWHNWDQTILAPWSYKSGGPPRETEDQLAAATAMADAMTATNNVFEGYKAGIAADLLYEMSGSSNDYGFAGTPNAKYSYVVELRDRGQFGFLIPEEQIRPTGEESYDGVIALLKWIIENDYEK
ncbi:Carboxypeptidase A4 [Holothuria leucospilota]|uniref:Carboxypeptidase A4 n=1 Tax=Holothuria leucospilota TaxID=206669 RepID=A0A9Q1CGW6_HOLLE|nr:Carboxypeptidase A4 [Holothuria leucospilota]